MLLNKSIWWSHSVAMLVAVSDPITSKLSFLDVTSYLFFNKMLQNSKLTICLNKQQEFYLIYKFNLNYNFLTKWYLLQKIIFQYCVVSWCIVFRPNICCWLAIISCRSLVNLAPHIHIFDRQSHCVTYCVIPSTCPFSMPFGGCGRVGITMRTASRYMSFEYIN